jgi:hypothetical protein
MAGEGGKKLLLLEKAGFSPKEIEDWKAKTSQALNTAGYSQQEVRKYFGAKEPNLKPLDRQIQQNFAKPSKEGGPPRIQEAKNIIDAFEAGYDVSVSSLMMGNKPDMTLPENAKWFHRIASATGTVIGDIPGMIAGNVIGTFAGASAGSVVPVGGSAVGGMVGGAYGLFAGPEIIRGILMSAYEDGGVEDWEDFWTRASGIFWQQFKAGTLGVATLGTGKGAGALTSKATKTLSPLAAKAATTSAITGAEVTTLATIGAALEGQMPRATDFSDAAILLTGIKVSGKAGGHVVKKLRKIFTKTGLQPAEVVDQAKADPRLHQELVAAGDEIPSRFKGPKDPIEPNATEIKPEMRKSIVPGEDGPSHFIVEKPPAPKVEPKPEPKPEPKLPEMSEAEKIVANSMGEQPSPSKKNFNEFVRTAIDDKWPINEFKLKVEKGELNPLEDPYVLGRLTTGDWGRAQHFIEFGTLDFKTMQPRLDGMSLANAVKPVKGELASFDRYLRARSSKERAEKLTKNKKKTGLDPKAASKFIEERKATFEQPAENVTKYSNQVLDYMVNSGIVGLKEAVQFKVLHENYAPLHKVMDVFIGESASISKKPIKGIKGSDRKVVSPIESLVKNTYSSVHLAEVNRTLLQMKRLALENPEALSPFFRKVKPTLGSTKLSPAETRKVLREHGIEVPPGTKLETLDIFRARQSSLGKNQHWIFENGKAEKWELDPQLSKAVAALDPAMTNAALKFLASSNIAKVLTKPTTGLRVGSVFAPEFMGKNFLKDQVSAFAFGDSFIPGWDFLSGLKSFVTKDVHFQDYIRSGASNSAKVSVDRNHVKYNLSQLSKQTHILGAAHNVIKSPIEFLKLTAEATEVSTRLGYFKSRYKHYKKIGISDTNALLKAGLDAKEVSVDFSKAGSYGRPLNLIMAFWNPQVQSLDKLYRALKEKPGPTLTKGILGITLPSFYLWYINHDQGWYKKLQRWEKDTYWHFKLTPKGNIYRIPKPHEMGHIFGTSVERVMDRYVGANPHGLDNMDETFLKSLAVNVVPDVARPLVETWANKSFFTGNNLITPGMEKRLPVERYTEWTTEAAKVMSSVLSRIPTLDRSQHISPVIVENWVRAWSGSLGNHALKIMDEILIKGGVIEDPIRPERTIHDIPFVKAFVSRQATGRTFYTEKFYELYQRNEEVLGSLKFNIKMGNFEKAEKLLVADQYKDQLLSLAKIKNGLSGVRNLIRMIHYSKAFTPSEKRNLIESLYEDMNTAAKLGVEMLRAFEEVIDE